MLLEKGITGFFDARDGYLEESAFSEFKKYCYGFKVQGWDLADICNLDHISYYYAWWNVDGQKIYILQNKFYSYLAFTEELQQNEKVFIAPPNSFQDPLYGKILSAEVLNDPWEEKKMHHLSNAELEQIRYWKPGSIGNIIFNEWD